MKRKHGIYISILIGVTVILNVLFMYQNFVLLKKISDIDKQTASAINSWTQYFADSDIEVINY